MSQSLRSDKMIFTTNNLIATECFVNTKKIEQKVVSGFARVDSKEKILKLKVKATFKNDNFSVEVGDFVLVKESDFLQKQLSTVPYSLPGIEGEVNLIYSERVVGVEKE